MKHLKGINQTYTEITTVKFRSINKFYTISQRDIDLISKSISKNIKNAPDPKGIAVNSVTIEGLHILMDGDEYFYIVEFYKMGYIVYKCDQVEGVIDCLKDIYSL